MQFVVLVGGLLAAITLLVSPIAATGKLHHFTANLHLPAPD